MPWVTEMNFKMFIPGKVCEEFNEFHDPANTVLVIEAEVGCLVAGVHVLDESLQKLLYACRDLDLLEDAKF